VSLREAVAHPVLKPVNQIMTGRMTWLLLALIALVVIGLSTVVIYIVTSPK
jgi:hypothetical protein